MPTITNNLFPPVLPDSQPAFIRTQNFRIYFSLSEYNNINDIKNVQISIKNQKTNRSALNPSKYPSEIKLIDIEDVYLDDTKEGDYKYYIQINVNAIVNNSDIINNYFEINQYYIAQMRFTSTSASDPPSSGGIDTWLFNQRDNFSEWSTITLLKGIDTPLISIPILENQPEEGLTVQLNKIAGRLYYENSPQQTQYLKNYTITIYKSSNLSKPVYKTQEMQTNQYNPNEFICNIPYEFDKDINHTLEFTYITNNGYTPNEPLTYTFKIRSGQSQELSGYINITSEDDRGRIKFDIDFQNSAATNKNLIIKRSSSYSNFKIWQPLKTILHDSASLRHIWYDTTVESGVWYKYRIEQEDQNGLGAVTQTEQPILCKFEDIFLVTKDKQLKIQFNPSIGDFKYNTTESQQVTLGSQFPFIRRNSNNYYRSFSIGGLISAYSDDNNWYGVTYEDNKFNYKYERQPFTSSHEIYGDSKQLYSNYNNENDIHLYEDYFYERQFREKVIEFLYANDIKLFKSLTEGNILIKLQNVGFQPVNELGRRLYSFTATAIELDALSIENFNKYNIINKYCYTYKIDSLTDYFESGSSIITNYILQIPSLSSYDIDSLKISRIKIQIKPPSNTNAIFYLKTINDPELKRYETQQLFLNLEFSEDEPIEDCYFYGIHINQYTQTDEYYYSTEDVQNPITNGVYYIFYSTDGSFKIDNYISYDAREMLLTTEEKETSVILQSENKTNNTINYLRHYALHAESLYEKYIYYNGNWYPFTDAGDAILTTHAKITYYYEIKEMN